MKSRFGGLWVQGGAGVWSLTNVPAALTSWTDASDGIGGIDADLVDGKIVVKVPGVYMLYASLSFTIPAGSILTAIFYVNGVAGGYSARAEGIASGGPVNLFMIGAGMGDVGDVVQVYIYSDQAGGTNFTLVDGQFGALSL